MALSSMARRFAGRNLLLSAALAPVLGLSAGPAHAQTVNLSANALVIACTGANDTGHGCNQAVASPQVKPWFTPVTATASGTAFGSGFIGGGPAMIIDLGAAHTINEIKVIFRFPVWRRIPSRTAPIASSSMGAWTTKIGPLLPPFNHRLTAQFTPA
jgi:hypothetical protein